MASSDQIASFRRAINIVARQAPAEHREPMALFDAHLDLYGPLLADRVMDELEREGFTDRLHIQTFNRGYQEGYDSGFNDGLAEDPTKQATSEEDTK